MPSLKRARQRFTFEYKLKVIARADEIGNRAAAREFEIDESMIRYWRKKKDVMTKLAKAPTHLPYWYRQVSCIGKNFERMDHQPKREQPCSHYRHDPSQGKRISKADECR